VRMRFTEYVVRFVRLAARYEELAVGSTKLGCASAPFLDGSLGSGIVFPDEAVAFKELTANASRIEGWRRTKSYQYYVQVRSSSSKRCRPQGVLIYCTGFQKIPGNRCYSGIRSISSTFKIAAGQKLTGRGSRAHRAFNSRQLADIRTNS
jgi:hypothetical protein